MWRTPSLVILMKKVIALLLSVVWLYESKPYNVNHDCYVLNGSTREHVRSMLWNIVPNGTFLSWTITRWRHQHFWPWKKNRTPQLAIDQFPGGRHQLISRKTPGWVEAHTTDVVLFCRTKSNYYSFALKRHKVPFSKLQFLCVKVASVQIFKTPGIQAKLNA